MSTVHIKPSELAGNDLRDLSERLAAGTDCIAILPDRLRILLRSVVDRLRSGEEIMVAGAQDEITVAETAQLLGTSTEYVLVTLKHGGLPSRSVEDEVKVPLAEVLRFRDRQTILQEMRDIGYENEQEDDPDGWQ